MTNQTVATGLEQVVAGALRLPKGTRLGLLANPTAVTRRFLHAADLLRAMPDFKLTALYGPEHGIRGDAQYMESVAEAIDKKTGLPVFSLYGKEEASLTPTADSLKDIDVLVFDIQDVGARYYTYVWTMCLAMRACARAGKKVVVLDRPNPIGGTRVEGGDIEPRYVSFVGLKSIPNRHGMTAGEIATWAKDDEKLDLDLTVVKALGWRRQQWFSDTGLPWVLPSPNMPTPDTALVYPGMCLLEGTEISEGRGTTRPFEIAGAPYIDGEALRQCLDGENLPGVEFRPLAFTPTFDKYKGQLCGGVQLHVVDRDVFRPYLTGVAFVWAVKRLWPTQFAWRKQAYEFRDDVPAFDLLTGSAAVRTAIDNGSSLGDVVETWQSAEKSFSSRRQQWLLYP
jgi:uncharacterized protein YbbC (DUF1343 family)